MKRSYNKKNLEILEGIWDTTGKKNIVCPKCGKNMVMVQIEPIQDTDNPYTPYDTIIECTSCDYKIRTESFTILGCVKNFDLKRIELASWSPSGSRVISNYEHVLNYDTLKQLKKSGELKEFLVVNEQVVQVIG